MFSVVSEELLLALNRSTEGGGQDECAITLVQDSSSTCRGNIPSSRVTMILTQLARARASLTLRI
jgi:hypothetical protein